MNKIRKSIIGALLLSAVFLYSSCQKKADSLPQSPLLSPEAASEKKPVKIKYGHPVKIGNGIAKAWVSENSCGKPLAVGIDFSEKTLCGLPSASEEYVLDLPHNAATNFFKHLVINWNPNGHVPFPIYGVPHFDFHFYRITEAERMMIGANDSVQFAHAPASQYVPSMYLQAPGGDPMMGAHWVDLLSSEFNGGAFTKTFIWGSYDGEFIFWEPMVTLAYLLTQPDDNIPLRQPLAFQHNGWYPKSYVVKYSTSPKHYTIALTDLTFHKGQ